VGAVYARDGHDLLVVDADSHVIEPPGAWDAFVSHAYAERAPRLLTDDGTDWLVVDGEKFFSYAMSGGLARGDKGFPDAGGRARGRWEECILPGAYDVEQRLADMDRDGIDIGILYPTSGMGLFNLADRALARELALAHTRWVAELCSRCPSRLKGVGVVLADDPLQAAADIELCRALGHVQVLIPLFAGGRDFSDPWWDPIWDKAASLKMPLGSHAFALGRARHQAGSDSLVEALVDRTAVVERALVALVFGGVLDRFEGLRFVSVENEAGWAAGLIDRADVSYRRGRRSAPGLPGCRRLPSDIFHQQIHFTFIRDQTAIDARRVVGPANLMWSTDYPHNSSTWPDSRQGLSGYLRPEVGVEEVAAIVGGNALRLYGLTAGVSG
jgi:predicted TIM-barrel fold metal-dependent hydrolase